MSSLAKHVIHQPKPHRTAILVIFVAVLTFAAQSFFKKDQVRKQEDNIQKLTDEISRLQKHNEQYTFTSEQHFSQLSLEQATTGQLRTELSQLQEQVLTLNKDLLFYQKITKGSSSSKLQIGELHLSADNIQPDIIRYRFVISQGKKINKPMTGTINISLNNDNKGTAQKLVLEQQQLNLRHVQVIEGKVEITDEIKPISITVELIQKKKTTLSRTFDWQLTPDN